MKRDYFISENGNYAETMTKTVEPYLRRHGVTGYFRGHDGSPIYYEKYLAGNAKGNIVVSHGFTESAEKFHEMYWYFLHMGYNVFALDHRGHGRSFRYNRDPETVTVRRFEEYTEDFHIFISTVVLPDAAEKPLFLYSHSMGGAVAVQYLQTHPGVFRKAVLSAPMIAPRTADIPYGPAQVIMTLGRKLGLRDKTVFGYAGFNPKRTYENSHDTSKARFDYYHAKRVADRCKQTSSPSFAWVSEAIGVSAKNLDPERNAAVTLPVLLFQPEEDTSVFSEKEDEFIRQIPCGRIERMADSKHEVYMAVDGTVEKYLDLIQEFLGE